MPEINWKWSDPQPHQKYFTDLNEEHIVASVGVGEIRSGRNEGPIYRAFCGVLKFQPDSSKKSPSTDWEDDTDWYFPRKDDIYSHLRPIADIADMMGLDEVKTDEVTTAWHSRMCLRCRAYAALSAARGRKVIAKGLEPPSTLRGLYRQVARREYIYPALDLPFERRPGVTTPSLRDVTPSRNPPTQAKPSAPQHDDWGARLDKEKTWRIVESSLRTELFATEERRYSNKDSPASTTHTLTISQTISRTISVDTTATISAGTEVRAGLGVSAKSTIEATLAAKYGITKQQTLTVSESASIQVPPKSAVLVKIFWYRHYQDGHLEAESVQGSSIPYSVVMRLSFDVETTTLNNNAS